MLDIYAKRKEYQQQYPKILEFNLVDFVTHFKVVNGQLQDQEKNIVARVFPNYSPNPSGKNYSLYCKYQLLRYKPWHDSLNNVLGNENPNDSSYIAVWKEFLSSPYGKQHVPNWAAKLQQALHCVVQVAEEPLPNGAHDNPLQEDWMIVAQLHNTNSDTCQSSDQTINDWSLDRAKYNEQEIAEMPKWIEINKNNSLCSSQYVPVDTSCFSEQQRLAYDIILNHSNKKSTKEPLLLIVTGGAGTGKSFLINAVRNCLKLNCAETATTGKAAFSINGVTIHSLLKQGSHKDLTGQCLAVLQESLAQIDYIIIDE